MKLAIIIPYRDRRDNLDIFLPHMVNFLKNKQIDYEIYIIEQFDDKPFNYGKLCNVGVSQTNEIADYYCFHDVDVLPLNDDADYSYKDTPTQLFYENSNKKILLPYDQFFGGVVVMNKEDFFKVNGFNNNYWGKGYVDLDLLYRCEKNNLPLVKKYNYKNNDDLNLDLKNRNIIKNVSKITINKKSLIVAQKTNIISKNFTLSFHYEDKRSKGNNNKICIFRTYGKDILQLFSIDNQLIFQFFCNGEFFQFEIKEMEINKLNHYTITHDYVKKEFNIFVNGKKIKDVTYVITYDYVGKTVAIGDNENKQKIELFDFKLLDRKLSNNEINKNFYYGLTSNCLEFNTISFYKNTGSFVDKKLNIWEFLSKEENETVNNQGVLINNKIELKINSEVKLPNRLKGRYKIIDEKFTNIENSYDPDIIENRRNYYDDILSEKIDTGKYGYKSLKYVFLNKEKVDENVFWIKVSI